MSPLISYLEQKVNPRITTLWLREIGVKNVTHDLAGLGGLVYADLSGNGATGSFPTAFQNMANLSELWLSNNAISGPLPSFLSSMTSLRGLLLDHNSFTSTVPDMSMLVNLKRLYLNNNTFTSEPVDQILPPYVTHCSLESSGLCLSTPVASATRSAACYTAGLASCPGSSVGNPIVASPSTSSGSSASPSPASNTVSNPIGERISGGGFAGSTVAAIIIPLVIVVLGLMCAGAYARRRYRIKRGHDPPWWPSWNSSGNGLSASNPNLVRKFDDSTWVLEAPNTNGAVDDKRRMRSAFGRKLSQRHAKNGIKDFTLGLDPTRRATKLKRSRSNAAALEPDARPLVRRPLTPPSEDDNSEKEGSIYAEMDARSDGTPGSPMVAASRNDPWSSATSGANANFAPPLRVNVSVGDLIDLGPVSGYEGSESGVDSVASPILMQPTRTIPPAG
ncbi:hypothetical protein HDU93_005290 [Gonapodya sp. JEL0774]|nr:hypothetical protein HDU93_005290 [Gonapodya sp. JEL0774]